MKLLRDAVVIRGGYHDMSNVRNLAKYMENIATVNDRPLGAPKKDRATVIKGEKNNFFFLPFFTGVIIMLNLLLFPQVVVVCENHKISN